jgi:hypothetical protein
MASEILPLHRALLAENAWQEIEVWALAGLTLPRRWDWQTIRAETHSKERYFFALAQQRGFGRNLEQAYKAFAGEAAGRYNRICQLCPEVVALEGQIERWLTQLAEH